MNCGVNQEEGCIQALIEKYDVKIIKHPNTIICEDHEEMSRKSAELIANAVAKKSSTLICLPAGNTAKRTYEILKIMSDNGKVNFSKAKFVALDEWLDLEVDSENCEAFMFKNFYKPLGIRNEQIVLFNLKEKNLDAECKRIDKFIFANGGIDCVLLGIGMNGHLGLNEPNEDFYSYTRVVNLDSVTAHVGQKYFSQSTNLTRGITLGIRHFLEAEMVILQASTVNKAGIIGQLYSSPPTTKIPATAMKLLKNGIIILDRDAASKI